MGVQLGITRLYGRAPRGERAVGSFIRNRGRNLTVLGALTLSGMAGVMAVEGGTDKHVFKAYLREVLLPSVPAGSILVMDNLGAHHAIGVEDLIREAGCEVFYMPSYSPELNPLTEAWAKVKVLLRGAGARTREALLRELAAALGRVTRGDALGFFGHAGYHVKS